MYRAHYKSPLGDMILASDGPSLTGLWFEKYFADNMDQSAENLPVFAMTKRWLDGYFAGEIPDFTPPISMLTTPFRKEVWNILLKIPYGKTVTYGDIARNLGKPARAVGGAVAHNAIAVIIPCHRVIGASGSLTGYAGGIERKAKLLRLEQSGQLKSRKFSRSELL